jgi:deoxyribodipyrimidine photo-lyase
MSPPVILWFRQDLRLADNPALRAAAEQGPIIPLYVLDDETPGQWKLGGASRWWLHNSLKALARELERGGSNLVLRRGAADALVRAVAAETGARAVYWNRQYEPWAIARDTALKAKLKAQGLTVETFNGSLLKEPWQVKTGADTPFKVFTPFWKAASAAIDGDAPLPAPKKLAAPAAWPRSETLDTWKLLPSRPNWAAGFEPLWTPGEVGAQQRLKRFLDSALAGYADGRDQPARESTSRLSAHLHFGEISPRQVWRAVDHARHDAKQETSVTKFLSELGWREFSAHLLYHFPTLPERNFRSAFDPFPWDRNERAFKAWSKGQTGYPIVDAGMRELWTTGTMHNRVRMIAASFLIKHLMIDWRKGAAWFWDTLLDADLANNSASWQWVAGSGADAAPYFRIFNPVLQGEKFDPEGAYTKRWLPELEACDARFVHRPWTAPNAKALNYPPPIVDHGKARARALAAFKTIQAAPGAR